MSTPQLTEPGKNLEPKNRGFPRADELDPTLSGPQHSSRQRHWHTRCKFIKRDGTQCRNWAMKGAGVCRTPQHGGSLPSVRRKAALRLAHMAEMSAEQYEFCLLPYTAQLLRLQAARATMRMFNVNAREGEKELKKNDHARVDSVIEGLKK